MTPITIQHDGPLAVLTIEHPQTAGELFDTEDLKAAVRSFLQHGPGHATFTGS